ncbi:hypothetical protein GGI19_003271 [Coemansia pectinata]|uniref:G protein-coupled receptor n=1 Tax=Coemansia pectinata TaxID=1052879 RepID=A0A9W8H007_9FUNG|nr:hypothetical protein GGI19_003271 [Coemansia pectinata]
MANESYSHGILGRWAVIGHGFNIASIVSSGFVIGAVVSACIRNRRLYNSPSFRLSAWIAACDTVYSACQLCVFENAYMRTLSETRLRIIHWLMSASTMSFVFMSVSVALHLLLTMVTPFSHIARRIQPWYEYVSLFLGFILTHPILYIYKMLQWSSRAQIFHIYDDPTYYKITSWLTKWAWLFAACVFMFIVLVLTITKMCKSSKNLKEQMTYPAHIYDSGDTNYMSLGHMTKQNIRLVTIRLMLYPVVPILTQIWVLSANMSAKCPMWLYVMANLVPATQGMINFLVFAFNPAWDNLRRQLFKKKRTSVHVSEFSTLKGSSIGSTHFDLEADYDLSRPATLKN